MLSIPLLGGDIGLLGSPLQAPLTRKRYNIGRPRKVPWRNKPQGSELVQRRMEVPSQPPAPNPSPIRRIINSWLCSNCGPEPSMVGAIFLCCRLQPSHRELGGNAALVTLR